MSTDRELMKQALRYMESVGQMDMHPEEWAVAVALREKLAQPEQEPVAIGWYIEGFSSVLGPIRPEVRYEEWRPFYALRTPPAQRKPLTAEEIYEMYNEPRSDAEMVAFARAIEAKLREKNT